MKFKDDYIPRLSIQLSPELQKRYQENIPWGLGKTLVTTMLEDVFDLVDKYGKGIIALIINKKLKISDILTMEVDLNVNYTQLAAQFDNALRKTRDANHSNSRKQDEEPGGDG